MRTMEKEEFCRRIRALETSMYRYALGMLRNHADAEDAVSEAVLKAYAHLAQLKNPDSFKAWLMSILSNEIRRLGVYKSRIEPCEDMGRYEKCKEDGQGELWHLVTALPQEFRDVVILYYYEGFLAKEISRMLKIPEGTVKSRLGRAREKLRAALEEENA